MCFFRALKVNFGHMFKKPAAKVVEILQEDVILWTFFQKKNAF